MLCEAFRLHRAMLRMAKKKDRPFLKKGAAKNFFLPPVALSRTKQKGKKVFFLFAVAKSLEPI
jgi:hypothetical protein